MKKFNLYDEGALAKLTELQRDKAWDLEASIDWNTGIDFNKPLVSLDDNALFFPGASCEQRTAISQMMGLIIATCICEMEECLIRFKKISWIDIINRYPVSPEFFELGEQFFEEEVKHSTAFRRYLHLFSQGLGVDPEDLRKTLPLVEKTKTEWILKKNIERGGLAFWWVVAQVEQEFLLLYHSMAPHKKDLEPLYFTLHQKHFEEEARHAPFPYLMLNLLSTRVKHPFQILHTKIDLALSQGLQLFWAGHSLHRTRAIKKIADKAPLFKIIAEVLPLLEKQPPWKVFWSFLTSAPYVSPLVNPKYHLQISRFSKSLGAWSLPFPAPNPKPLRAN